MLTLPFLLAPDSPATGGPRPIGRILLDERRLAAHELVCVFEVLAQSLGREAAVRDPRVRAAARRYRALCGQRG